MLAKVTRVRDPNLKYTPATLENRRLFRQNKLRNRRNSNKRLTTSLKRRRRWSRNPTLEEGHAPGGVVPIVSFFSGKEACTVLLTQVNTAHTVPEVLVQLKHSYGYGGSGQKASYAHSTTDRNAGLGLTGWLGPVLDFSRFRGCQRSATGQEAPALGLTPAGTNDLRCPRVVVQGPSLLHRGDVVTDRRLACAHALRPRASPGDVRRQLEVRCAGDFVSVFLCCFCCSCVRAAAGWCCCGNETGESSPEDGGPDAAGAGEFPITLVDLLGGEAPKRAAQERSEAQKAQEATLASIEVESKKTSAEPKEPAAVTQIDFSKYSKKAVSYLARNFYNLKYVALVLAFGINFMLLFYKLTTFGDDEEAAEGSGEDLMGLASGMGSGLVDAVLEGGSGDGGNGEGEEDGEDPLEKVEVDEDFFYMEHVMRIAACLHSLVSLCLLIAYSHLKIPLAIFKREKEIARRLEFDGRFIAEQPEDDDIKSHWDKLVISAKTFPVNYWDKFVKKKVSIKTFLLLNCKLPPEAEQVQRGLLEVVPMVVVFFESVKTRTTLQRRPASARRDRKQLHNKIRTLPGPGST
ncbi:ryanodine receptor 3, brain [Culex quinquefasciatus]|uniref:Ryanodine receptor 3, brain n=1 Tax=Culex quinquefasciatus TaxID=7176 RepID=B0XF94_CULQU|nr:ryanodine receptor 3, brain [Culex quinquefasciatus]|eukprot:XP_001868316.1 ryanodine receptor 3, brain [Culex quinquefasciatus]